MAARRARCAGFTLIELLVVIAILALLMSILSPSLRRVRRITHSAMCASHVRQLAVGLSAYLQGNRQRLWDDSQYNAQDDTGRWFSQRIPPYLGSGVEELLCPTASDFNNDPWSWGSATTVWGGPGTESWWMGGHYGSFGMNIWLTDVRGMGWQEGLWGMPATAELPADKVPVFADCAWTGSWCRTTDLPPNDLRQGATPAHGVTDQYHGIARHCVDRHDRAVNVAFLDGGARRVGLEELWHLRWSPQFQPSDITFP